MSGLNEHQIRRVLATFTHVDGLLEDIDRLATDALSPFAKERADLAPDEARLLRAFEAQARARMLTALDRLRIPRPQPAASARWSVTTSLTFADITLSELTESALRGYGAVDAAASAELLALVADLRKLMARGKALLHEHDPGGLSDKLAGMPGLVGEVLRGVDRLSVELGLADVRPLIAAAADRAGATTFDVGIFGRVSAGKSSLINALVGVAILPVGATPVTAVPIRIARGEPGASVTDIDSQSHRIALASIPEYATEAGNPQNTKGVRAIDVRVPSMLEGLRLFDTPGVGSLGASGPAQAFAWLPRCDLGLVLVAAGNAVSMEDLALIAGLRHAGIGCRVLFSKADLLRDDELARVIAYVDREIAQVLGPDHGLEVRPVSTVPGHEASLASLRADVLAPLAADHSRMAADAFKARLRHVIAATDAALSARGATSAVRVHVHAARAAAEQVIRREADHLAESTTDVLARAADALLAAWLTDADGRGAVQASVLGAGGAALAAVREAVELALPNGRAMDPDGRRLPPIFDPAFLDTLPPLPAPVIARGAIGRRLATGRLERLTAPLGQALSRYAGRLYAWGTAMLDAQAERPISIERERGLHNAELARLDAAVSTS